MLNAAIRRRKNARTDAAPPALQSLAERERAAALVSAAREKLDAFAKIPDHQLVWQFSPVGMLIYADAATKLGDLGNLDGIGLLLKLASFDLNRDGSMSESTFQQFLAEGQLLFDGIQGAALNYSVMIMLFMTIFASYFIQHAGADAYSVPAESVAMRLRTELSNPASADEFADLASWVWPEDAAAQVSLRRAMYRVEGGLLGFGFIICNVGFVEALFLYISSTTALPSVVGKLEYLKQNTQGLAMSFMAGTSAFDMAIMVLPFVAARISAYMFLVACAVLVVFVLIFAYIVSPIGHVTKILRAQHREVQRILRAPDANRHSPAAGLATVAQDQAQGAAHEAVQDDDDELAALISAALGRDVFFSADSRAEVVRQLRKAGFTSRLLRAAAAEGGGFNGVAAALKDAGPALDALLRPGDRMAIALAAKLLYDRTGC